MHLCKQQNQLTMSSKAKTRQEIANEYGICTKTLKKWLALNNITLGRGLIPPKDQKLIYESLGYPSSS